MPLLQDLNKVRTILNRDRPWSAYILGDLAPGSVEHCTFHCTENGDGIVALYKGLGFQILFWLNAEAAVLDEFHEAAVFLNVRLQDAGMLAGRYRFVEPKLMGRFILDLQTWRPAPVVGAQRLTAAHLAALQTLYADGEEDNDQPDFFYPNMLTEGIFYACWEGSELIAVAGTHQVVQQESVAAVGNVYTRRDRRGKGLAASMTSAVTIELLKMGISTIVLNVEAAKPNARRVYERLGFQLHCEFLEGRAVREVF